MNTHSPVLAGPTAMLTSNPQSRSFAVRIPPVAVVVITGMLAWLGCRAYPALKVESAAGLWLTAALMAAGAGCSLGGVLSFRRARTTVNPMTPEAATTLVISGIYRFTRNPMYLGFALLLGAWATWLANPVALLALPLFVSYLNRFQIRAEEAALHARFGSAFTHYQAQVRRWI
ncbi:MAG: isoprenylcysteine carboxylmethyltransferase family protein [Opitutus sp.]